MPVLSSDRNLFTYENLFHAYSEDIVLLYTKEYTHYKAMKHSFSHSVWLHELTDHLSPMRSFIYHLNYLHKMSKMTSSKIPLDE